MWVVKTYSKSQVTSGGLRDNYYIFEASVYHPTCHELRLGFACSYEACYKLDGSGVIYGEIHYSHDEFHKLFPQVQQEVIDRAMGQAKENLSKLKMAEDFDQYTANL